MNFKHPIRFSRWLPLPILLLALSTQFVFDDRRELLYKWGLHDLNSSHGMALAANLSLANPFLAFHRQGIPGPDGTAAVVPYTSWPSWTFAVVRPAFLLFPDHLPAQIYTARVIMLLLFSASAVLAWLVLTRLFASRWIALTATLLSFSSLYMLFYADMVFVEQQVLLGILLAFHGMVVFEQEGRFRQLVLKVAFAVLMGWQAFAVLLPFVALGMARALWRALRDPSRSPGRVLRALNGRHLHIGLFSLALGLLVLGHGMFLDYHYRLGSKHRSVTRLRVIQKLMIRSGLRDGGGRHADALEWRTFLPVQLARIAGASTPYLFQEGSGTAAAAGWSRRDFTSPGVVAGGLLALAVCAVGIAFVRHKLLLATLASFGLCWALLMREHAAAHDFDAIFYVGVPLAGCGLVLLWARRRFGDGPLMVLGMAAAVVFAASGHRMSGWSGTAEAAGGDRTELADFAAIRRLVDPGRVVYVPAGEYRRRLTDDSHDVSYYLHGRVIEYETTRTNARYAGFGRPELADFIVTRDRMEGTVEGRPALLTPHNRHFFLYRMADYQRLYAELDDPVIESDWNVYLQDGHLIYTRSACDLEGAAATGTRFFLHVYPMDVNDLPEARRPYGYHNLDLRVLYPDSHQVRLPGLCVIKQRLPDTGFSRIRTGETVGEDDDAVPYEVRLGDGMVWYEKKSCDHGDGDAADVRWFVHFHPVDLHDLPSRSWKSRLHGFHNISRKRLPRGSPCGVFLVRLPAWPPSFVRTGQWTEKTGTLWAVTRYPGVTPGTRLWEGTFYNPEYVENMMAEAGEPVLQGGRWTVHHHGSRLFYSREACSAEDVAARFFLHLVPADPGDLPEHRRPHGYDNLDFDFASHRAVAGQCLAVRELPGYAVTEMRTGQVLPGAGRLWEDRFYPAAPERRAQEAQP